MLLDLVKNMNFTLLYRFRKKIPFFVKIKVDVVNLETEHIQVVRPLKLFMDLGLVQVGSHLFQRNLTMTRNTMSSELVRIALGFLSKN